jgi:hypothetical protein
MKYYAVMEFFPPPNGNSLNLHKIFSIILPPTFSFLADRRGKMCAGKAGNEFKRK